MRWRGVAQVNIEQHTNRDLEMARRHLQLAIARLDRLHLAIPAAYADLALAKLDTRHPEGLLTAGRVSNLPPLLR
jgi:hypothetical protein